MPRISSPSRLLSALLVLACSEAGAPSSPPPPPVADEAWDAIATHAGALPRTVYEFDEGPIEGATWEYRLDSAVVVLRPTGTYERRTWYSEWITLAPGAPTEKVLGFMDYDRGNWTRAAGAITLASEWVQHQVVHGLVEDSDDMVLTQGLVWGDPTFAVRFKRR